VDDEGDHRPAASAPLRARGPFQGARHRPDRLLHGRCWSTWFRVSRGHRPGRRQGTAALQ
jgi:hypothetical protein